MTGLNKTQLRNPEISQSHRNRGRRSKSFIQAFKDCHCPHITYRTWTIHIDVLCCVFCSLHCTSSLCHYMFQVTVSVMEHWCAFKNKDCFANQTKGWFLLTNWAIICCLGLLVISFWIYFAMQAWPSHSGSTCFIIKKNCKKYKSYLKLVFAILKYIIRHIKHFFYSSPLICQARENQNRNLTIP